MMYIITILVICFVTTFNVNRIILSALPDNDKALYSLLVIVAGAVSNIIAAFGIQHYS